MVKGSWDSNPAKKKPLKTKTSSDYVLSKNPADPTFKSCNFVTSVLLLYNFLLSFVCFAKLKTIDYDHMF